MENEVIDIKYSVTKPGIKSPELDDKTSWLKIFAAEDVFILPKELVAVSTGVAFSFPDEIGLMFMPISGLSSKTFLRYPQGVMVLQNNNYSQEEVKILLENTYSENENTQKVHEYKLIDGTTVSDQNNLYDKGTVKICKGDCISHIMHVNACYTNTERIPKKPVKK